MNVDPPLLFNWDDVSAADEYWLYTGTTEDNLGLLVDSLTDSEYDASAFNFLFNTTYFWRVDTRRSNGGTDITTGTVWSFSTRAAPQNPPPQASNPAPADNATNVAINTAFDWAHVPEADQYKVYVGTDQNNLPLVSTRTISGYNHGNLAYDTEYFWRIDTVNEAGTTTGAVWSFRTAMAPSVPPDQASNPSPSSGATDVAVNTDMDWDTVAPGVSYRIHIGTSQSSIPLVTTLTESFYRPSTLFIHDQQYYWRIDTVGPGGTTTGNVWSFTTEVAPQDRPPQAGVVSPQDNATDVAIDSNLDWTTVSGTDEYRIHFGTDENNIPLVDTRTSLQSTAHILDDLAYDTEYFWRIDTVNEAGTTTGAVWSFRTLTDSMPALPDIANRTDAIGDQISGLQVTLPTATGGDTPIVYSISGLPPGLSFNPTTRQVIGIITGTAQTYLVEYTATDADGDDDTARFQWTVEERVPVAPDLPDLTNTVGDVIDIVLPVGTGGTGALSYSISGLPLGLQFDEATRRITGTITGTITG